MRVEIIKEVTADLVEAMESLIPQLTGYSRKVSKSYMDSIIRSDSTYLFVAKDDANNITGALTLVIFTIPTSKKAFIEDVVVDENAQGLGLGQKLVEKAIEFSKSKGVERIELSSNSSRIAANTLYQKLGFKIRETNYYRLEI